MLHISTSGMQADITYPLCRPRVIRLTTSTIRIASIRLSINSLMEFFTTWG